MRDLFPEYYRPTEEEFTLLWRDCTFTLDTNVLLNLYRYSSPARDQFLGILRTISDRLWIPHQVALEYQKNRVSVVLEQTSVCDKVEAQLRSALKDLEQNLRKPIVRDRHPFLDVDDLLKRINEFISGLVEQVRAHDEEQLALIDHDNIRDTLDSILEARIGPPYSHDRLDEVARLGKQRYNGQVPPGYKDEGYGDLVLWLQVIDHAKAEHRPIILVTDDRKEDWWLTPKGRTVGPRPELVSEIREEAGVPFYMYSADRFVDYARQYLAEQVEQDTIDEVTELRKRQEAALRETAWSLRSESADRPWLGPDTTIFSSWEGGPARRPWLAPDDAVQWPLQREDADRLWLASDVVIRPMSPRQAAATRLWIEEEAAKTDAARGSTENQRSEQSEAEDHTEAQEQ